MKRSVAVVLTFAMALVLSACGGPKLSPEETVSNAIDALKNMDISAISTYWGDGTFQDINTNAGSDSSATEQDGEIPEGIIKLVFSGITYKILSSQENIKAGMAKVSVDITNVLIQDMTYDYVSTAFSQKSGNGSSGVSQTPEEAIEMYSDLLSSNVHITVTSTVDITLELEDNTWVIIPSEEIVSALVGGKVSVSDAFDEAIIRYENDSPSVEETLLTDTNGVKIYSQGITRGEWDDRYCVNLKIENSTSSTICVQAREESVDGVMVNGNMSTKVAPGKTAYTSLDFEDYKLADNNIFSFGAASFKLHCFDNDNWSTIFDTNELTVTS